MGLKELAPFFPDIYCKYIRGDFCIGETPLRVFFVTSRCPGANPMVSQYHFSSFRRFPPPSLTSQLLFLTVHPVLSAIVCLPTCIWPSLMLQVCHRLLSTVTNDDHQKASPCCRHLPLCRTFLPFCCLPSLSSSIHPKLHFSE